MDDFDPPPNMWDQQLIDEIMSAKEKCPDKFVSHWEFDETDIDFASDKDIEEKKHIRFLWAAEHNKMEIVQQMYNLYPKLINCVDNDGYTPLHRSAYNGNIKIAQFLIKNGADINATTKNNWTPLHSAIHWRQQEMTICLIQNGADVNAKTKSNLTPLHVACTLDNREIIELLLLNVNIDVNVLSHNQETALDLCKRHNSFSFLFEMHSDLFSLTKT